MNTITQLQLEIITQQEIAAKLETTTKKREIEADKRATVADQRAIAAEQRVVKLTHDVSIINFFSV